MLRKFCVSSAFCALALISCTSLAFGQTAAASITGRVTDDTGLDVPGATVTATSPALQVGEMTTVTDERGNYRLSPLPIGTYEVTYTLPGFQSVKQENVRLGVGFVATLNVVLKVGSLNETITVSGVAPTVDVKSTETSTRITKETLEMLPSNRNGVLSMMSQAPGLRGPLDIPTNFTAVPSFRSYGREGNQWSTLEGVYTAAPSGSSGAANYWDYGTFDETQVAGIGKSVEAPIRGVAFAAIVKSGGNDLHGTITGAGTNHNFQSSNLDDALTARGINSGGLLEKQWDLGGDAGGRIVRDKIWFYGGLRKRLDATDYLGLTDPGGAPVPYIQAQHFETAKLSYQATQGLRFIGFYSRGTKQTDNTGLTPFAAWDTRYVYWVESHTQKVEAQYVKGNVVLSLQSGVWIYNFAQNTPMAPSNVARTEDLVTQRSTGNSGVTTRLNNKEQGRLHQTGSLTWYKPNSFKGNHTLKVGFDDIPEYNDVIGVNQPSGHYTLIFSNGVPSQIRTNNAPTVATAKSHFTGVYGSDNWTIGRRLTLNLGARFDHDNLWVPSQCQTGGAFSAALCLTDDIRRATWNSIAPRLSGVYDLGGHGTSAIKSGWGRFDLVRNAGGGQFNNPFSGGAAGAGNTTYRWRDLNGDKQYQPGEANLDPTGPDYLSGGNYYQFAGSLNLPDPHEGQPKEDQFFLGYERQVGADVSVRVTGLYNRVLHAQRTVGIQRPYAAYNIPITRPDPGPDGVLGTSDDPGRSLTYWDYSAQYAGSQNSGLMRSVPAGQPTATFRTIEFAASKRFTKGWALSSSFSATKAHEPFLETGSGGGGEGAVRPYTPNAEINVANTTWEWLANASFVYQFSHGLFAAANYQGRSGDPGARQVLVVGGTRIPNLVINAEPYGSLQLPPINTLDLRFDKKFTLSRHQSVALKLNVFNVLNANTTLSWNVRSGPSYLLPTSILPPRFVALSATYAF
jgi:hypothetical protein